MTGASFVHGHTAEAIPTPVQMQHELPASVVAHELVAKSRSDIRRIIRRRSDRLLVVVGPCSIHDPRAALSYADRLVSVRHELSCELEIVMRAYFEKPRTRSGWKGMLSDPDIDDSCDIERGVRTARGLMARLTDAGMPVALEFLSPIAAHYLSDLVSWGAIGARTTESQIHRELASGLPFLGITGTGHFARISTAGNPDCRLVLRGGVRPNYDAPSVGASCAALASSGLEQRLVIDASHGNSGKNHEKQVLVCEVIAEQVAEGEQRIVGVMIESNLLAGRKDHVAGDVTQGGISITDACLGWSDTVRLLERLAKAASNRRSLVNLLSPDGVTTRYQLS